MNADISLLYTMGENRMAPGVFTRAIEDLKATLAPFTSTPRQANVQPPPRPTITSMKQLCDIIESENPGSFGSQLTRLSCWSCYTLACYLLL